MKARGEMTGPDNRAAADRGDDVGRPVPAPHGGETPTTARSATPAPVDELEGLPLSGDLIDWMGFVRRQWVLMLAVWLVMMVLVVVALYLWPRQYESSAKFLVKNARQDLVVGPSESATAATREQMSETLLNTELELLRSRDILARVVDELSLQQPLIDSGMAPEVATERAIRGLGGRLVAATMRRTNLIWVSYTSGDPVLAASVVRHVADAYLAAHLAIHSTPGTYEMFQRQAADAGVELRRAEEELAALARSANLVNLDVQQQEALNSVQQTEAQVAALAAEIREQDTRARIAEIHMSRTPKRVPTSVRNVPSQSYVDRLNTMIVELHNKRTEALTKFNASDRFVLELDKQLADTKAALADARSMSVNEESTDINPTWLQLEAERTKARLQLAGIESRARQLTREMADQRRRTLEIAEAGPRYQQLVRNVTEAKNKHELFTKRQEEARIAEVLDRQQISNVVLAQAPVVSYVPAKPNVRLGLVAGAVLAAFIALGIAFLRELFGLKVSRGRGKTAEVTVLGISPATAQLR